MSKIIIANDLERKHIHSWRRYKEAKDTFYCTHPLCYMKMDLQFLYGKLASCDQCGKHFIVAPGEYKYQIVCPDCTDGQFELTLEGIRKSLTRLIREDIKRAIHIKLVLLNTRQRELKGLENTLATREKSVRAREIRWDQRVERDLQSIQEKRDKLALQMKVRHKKLLEIRSREITKSKTKPTEIGDVILAEMEKVIKNERIGFDGQE